MHWIIQYIIQHRNVSSLFLTVILSLLMLTSNTQRQQQIASSLSITVFFPFQFAFHQTTQIKNIFSENKKLKEDLAIITTRCSVFEEEATENKRLRDLIGFGEKISYSLIPARAVVREPSYYFRTVVINCGKKHGASLFMPVINRHGIVGKIVQVMNSISLVQLLRDPSERVSVMRKHSSDVGILETINRKNFFIKYRKHVEINIRDTMVTSGLGGIYPRGINVGVVTEIKDTNDPLFKDVFIKPCVNFAHLEEVFVMKLSPQWTAFRQELDSMETEQ